MSKHKLLFLFLVTITLFVLFNKTSIFTQNLLSTEKLGSSPDPSFSPLPSYMPATPITRWDPKGYTQRTIEGIEVSAKISGWGSDDKRLYVPVHMENKLESKFYIYVSARDFSLLDNKGNVLGYPLDNLERKYISTARFEFHYDQTLTGSLTFVGISDNFKSGILRYTPQIRGAGYIDIPLTKPELPVVF